MREQEIKNRIEEIENARFYLMMKDRWEREDYRRDDELVKELIGLKKELKGLN